MKLSFQVIFSGTLILLISCSSARSGKNKSKQSINLLLRENGTVNPEITGFWKSIGNGYILKATADSILLYSYTKNFCYKEKNDYIEGLLNTQARFTKKNDSITVYPADFGEKTNILQIKNSYFRIDGLPGNCISFSEMQQLSPRKLFTIFLETLKENYAFSIERNLNWDVIQNEYEKQISDSTTQNELFEIIGKVVVLTKDHHTKIITQDGKTIQYRGIPSAEIVSAAFNKQTEIENINDYFNLFFKENYKNISDSLLKGKGKKAANGKIEWGSLNNNIGYISIYSFANFAPADFSRKQQIDSLNNHMAQIIDALKDKKAIILDISFNFGGFDAGVLTIAGYFTDKPKLAYTSQVYNNGIFFDESNVYIRPADRITYTKPVYILMTDISRSAAEGFAMAMKANSNVKLAGTNTLGILSSMLGKSIGNFYSTSSNQRLLSPDGKYFEISGVTPDIKMKVFYRENIFGGHKEAVRKLMKIIETSQ